MIHDAHLAARIVKQECHDYEAYKEGVYGRDGQELAEKLGLRGIVLENQCTSTRQRYLDLITGEELRQPYAAIRYPFSLVESHRAGQTEYYYQFQLIFCCRGDGELWPVLDALRSRFHIDPTSAEAFDLWQNKRRG